MTPFCARWQAEILSCARLQAESTQEVGRSTRLRLVFTLHFFRAVVTSLRALSQNKARFWLFYLLIKRPVRQYILVQAV